MGVFWDTVYNASVHQSVYVTFETCRQNLRYACTYVVYSIEKSLINFSVVFYLIESGYHNCLHLLAPR